jgi:hypothetical protein
MQLQTTETEDFETTDEVVPAFAEQYMTTTEAVLALTARKLLDALESLHNPPQCRYGSLRIDPMVIRLY